MPQKKKSAGAMDAITVSATFPVAAKALCEAWLDSKEHSDFTGGEAVIDPKVGGAHSAWDGYISGRTLQIEPGRRIVQSWRTTEFPKGAKDSALEIIFTPVSGGTKVTLKHTGIPKGQGASYKQGWGDYYFDPMAKYFSRRAKPAK
jgi:activator of HSP90 ATPase